MPPPSNTQLGAAIRQVRKENGETIEGLAEKAGISWVYLSEVEHGKRNPTWDVIGSIATALGIEIADLARLAARMPEG